MVNPKLSTSALDRPDSASTTRRRGSTPYDAGSRRVKTVIQPGRLVSGKRAPDRKNIGIIRKFITTWKPWSDFIIDAMATPNEASPKARIAASGISSRTVSRFRFTPTKRSEERRVGKEERGQG